MAVLFIDPTYPEREEERESFFAEFETLLQEKFRGSFEIREVDAGPSASVPGWFVDAVSLGSALLTLPTMLENLSKWKGYAAKLSEISQSMGIAYAIDLPLACAIAIEKVGFTPAQSSESDIRVISCVRHSVNLND